MNDTKRKIIVKIAITDNLSKLKAGFKEGYNRAMYGSRRGVGCRKAYQRLLLYLPNNLWKDLTFPECMIFNSWIQIYMLRLMGV